MTVAEAQRDLRRAYVGGGPGALVSALVWLAAGLVERSHGTATAFTVLFLGGILIFPLSTLACRTIFRRAKEAPGNPLGMTALECTIAMIGGLVAAWLFLRFEPAYVFPLAAVAVGTHYLVFKTAYGDRIFWVLGALVTTIGLFDLFDMVPVPGGTIFAVAVIELVFAAILTVRALRR